MSTTSDEMRAVWEQSFAEQVERWAYNTAPVEALVRSVSYYLRERYSDDELKGLHFAEMGCCVGPNLVCLTDKGISVSGVDMAAPALGLGRETLEPHGHADRIGQL